MDKNAKPWGKLPKGWTGDSVHKFWDSLTGDVKHKVTKCIKKMEDKMDNPGAFCAGTADKVDPGWRTRKKAMYGTRVLVKDLPISFHKALKSVRYGRREIEIRKATSYSPQGAGGDGSRDFTIVLNMLTGQYDTEIGSWGGANIFNQTNRVDLDTRSFPIPTNGAVIKGSMSSGPTYAYILVPPENFQELLPSGSEEPLTELERKALRALSYKGDYRKDEWEYSGQLGKYSQDNPIFQSLVKKGLVKVTGVGVTLTLEGKNKMNSRMAKMASQVVQHYLAGDFE